MNDSVSQVKSLDPEKCDVNDSVSQVKSLDPVLEGKKAQKRFFLYIVRTVLIEH